MAVECQVVHAGRCPTLQSSRPRARVRSLAREVPDSLRRPVELTVAGRTIRLPVHAGDTLASVEVMKLMNHVKAGARGKIALEHRARVHRRPAPDGRARRLGRSWSGIALKRATSGSRKFDGIS